MCRWYHRAKGPLVWTSANEETGSHSICSNTQRTGVLPIQIRKTARVPSRIVSPPETISTFSQGGIRRAKAPGLSWNAKTTAGGAAIRVSTSKRIPKLLYKMRRSFRGQGPQATQPTLRARNRFTVYCFQLGGIVNVEILCSPCEAWRRMKN